MMHLLVALLLAPTPGTIGDNRSLLFDRAQGPTPVTDKDLRPGKLPDCRNAEEVQITLDQIRHGDKELFFIRDIRAFNRPTP